MDQFQQARINMVKNQLMPNGVNDDKILHAFLNTPKHLFAEGEWQSIAYFDGRIPLAPDREILSTDSFARMLQALQLQGTEHVLDIACGTGYSTAVFSQLCKAVVGVESSNDLSVKAAHNILSLGLRNVAIKQAELLSGAKESGPYDVIFINGALKEVPSNLLQQLATNGKLIMIKKSGALSVAIMLVRSDNNDSEIELFPAHANLI